MMKLKRLVFSLLFRISSMVPSLRRTELRSNLLRWRGSLVGANVYFGPKCRIAAPAMFSVGDDTVIGAKVFIDPWECVEVGAHVIIGDHVTLLTGGHDLHSPIFPGKHGTIKIRDYVWIAPNSMILGKVVVGYGAVIGAGSVVREDVPDLAIVLGNPAKVVGHRRCDVFSYSPGRFFRDQLTTM